MMDITPRLTSKTRIVAAADDVEDDSEVLDSPDGEATGVTAVGPDPGPAAGSDA